MNVATSWADELRAVLSATDEVARLLHELHAWTSDRVVPDDVLPREMPEPARTLFESLNQQVVTARDAAAAAFHRYSSGPLETLDMKQPLSREEYFLLQAMGATKEELPPTPWSLPSNSD